MAYTIKTEDLPEDRDLLIPLSVAVYDGEDARITCFGEFADTAQRYAGLFSDALLSREALGYLFSEIDPAMKRRGYAMPGDRFEIDVVCSLDRAPAQGGVVTVNAIDAFAYENLTTIDLAEAATLHQEVFVCVADGKVVSVAVENFAEDGFVEIACETAEGYRGKGCAYSTCAALCRDIIAGGYSVRWQCSEDNPASVALAGKLGFKEIGREAYMCYYAGESGEE